MKTQCLNNKGCQILLLIHKKLISPRQYRKHKSKFFYIKTMKSCHHPKNRMKRYYQVLLSVGAGTCPTSFDLLMTYSVEYALLLTNWQLSWIGSSSKVTPLFIPFNIKPCFIQHRTWLPHCNPWCSLSPQTVILSFFLPYLFYHWGSVEQSLIITRHSQY